MKMKLISIALSAVLAGSAVMPCMTAATAAESLAETVGEGWWTEIVPIDSPTADCIGYECTYLYEGVAVTCENIEALKQNGLNGIPVEWSDGIWSSYWQLSDTEFLLQPIEGLAKEFGNYTKYEGGIPDGAEDMTFTLPEEYTGLDEPVYVLFAQRHRVSRLEAAIAADSNVTALGVLFCGMLDPMEYTGACFRITAEDGVTLSAESFGKYAPYARLEPVDNTWYVSGGDEDTTLEEALVIQAQIAAMEGIKRADLLGDCPESLENPVAVTAEIVPFTATALLGDLDGDGKVTAYDASLALIGFNEAEILEYPVGDRTLTPAQEALGDIDGNGRLTAFDASMILTYFTLKEVAGFDDLTWEDVLPAK